jgi:general secretion pathway protein G
MTQKGDVMRQSHPSGTDLERNRNEGFTLIEIMAVVLIIGLLSTIVGVQIFSQVDKGRITATSAQISNLEAILELYRMDMANFPTSEDGLEALVTGPSSGSSSRRFPASGYISKGRVPPDPWGNEYQYEYPGRNNPHTFDLWSFGADGKTGGEGVNGDIGNWIEEAGT